MKSLLCVVVSGGVIAMSVNGQLRRAAPTDCIGKTCTIAGNFSADLTGVPDSRPSTWGTAEAVENRLTFKPPPRHRVRVLAVTGDLVAWPTRMGQGSAVVEPGRFAGVLWGMQTTGQDGSKWADWAADNCFLYVQAVTGGEAGVHMENTWVITFRFERSRNYERTTIRR